MITIGDTQYRNLEEQVEKNKNDILYILEEEGVLNEFGIRVVGDVDASGDLPDPTTYEGEFGDAYAVGTQTPYTLYIFTRANGTHSTNYWLNIGQFPLPGPTGPTGPEGEDGATGLPALQDRGHRTTSTVPIIGTALGTTPANFSRTPVVGDFFYQLVLGLNGTSAEGRSWITNNEITSIGNLANYRIRSVMETTGATGAPGMNGPQGPTGPMGPQGPIGPQGNPGQSFVIAGTVTASNQLPDPSTVADNIAYLVGTAAPYDLYVQLQDSSEWFNAGIVEGVQGPQGPQGQQGPQGEIGPTGPQGPQGPMPPLVDTRGNSVTDAISQQGIENIFYNSQVTLGTNSTASSVGTAALGYYAKTSSDYATALGSSAIASGDYATALGSGATVSGNYATAIGRSAKASSSYAIALGDGATASSSSATAIGRSAKASSSSATALGRSAKASGTNATALGNSASALGDSSLALGTNASIGLDGDNSIQIGEGNLNTPNMLQVKNFPLLDLTTGKIVSERLPADIPTFTDNGDGTMTISANGTTYKVAIVTE